MSNIRKGHVALNFKLLPFCAGRLAKVDIDGSKVGNRLTKVFERLHEVGLERLLDVVLLRIKLPILEVRLVNLQAPVVLFVASDVLD